MHRRTTAVIVAVALALSVTGCAARNEPVRESREALGTIVTIEAWGDDDVAVTRAIDDAFATIAKLEAELDAYSPTSTIGVFNSDPFHARRLPPDAITILDLVDTLGVSDEYSPALLGVLRLYDFGGARTVPSAWQLDVALEAARGFSRPSVDSAEFTPIRIPGRGMEQADFTPGLDFGGAAKGLALDQARETLRTSGAVTAAIVSAGSTTVTLGDKPDGEPWRVGIEDARDPGVPIASAQWQGEAALSTSGDYQQYFERDGVRYHHILDPATGTPARAVRTLTVVGRITGVESDILSTALFVRGPEGALAYAKEHGLGIHLTDSEGRTRLAPAPAESGVTLAGE